MAYESRQHDERGEASTCDEARGAATRPQTSARTLNGWIRWIASHWMGVAPVLGRCISDSCCRKPWREATTSAVTSTGSPVLDSSSHRLSAGRGLADSKRAHQPSCMPKTKVTTRYRGGNPR